MIEKLDILNNTTNVFTTDEYVTNVADGTTTINKINEIIDAINKLQGLQTKKTEPVDGVTGQHKWIGKLCKFWDDDEYYTYDILVDMDNDSHYPYKTNSTSYKYCEPVKSDSDIIYQGE